MQLVVISHYPKYGIDNLRRLVYNLLICSPGIDYDMCVVVNNNVIEETNEICEERIGIFLKEIIMDVINRPDIKYLTFPSKVIIQVRENVGMNIGAWNYGWHHNKIYDYYLLLQDEVNVISENWLNSFLTIAKQQESRGNDIFQIGESINTHWARSWDTLRKSNENQNIEIDSEKIGKVDYFLKCFKYWGVNEFDHGGHLRSLIWFFNAKTLHLINGFEIGDNYFSCIASEILTSLKVRKLNGQIIQIDNESFRYFWHPEWRKDGVSKKYKNKLY